VNRYRTAASAEFRRRLLSGETPEAGLKVQRAYCADGVFTFT